MALQQTPGSLGGSVALRPIILLDAVQLVLVQNGERQRAPKAKQMSSIAETALPNDVSFIGTCPRERMNELW
jgi:hypothetical protein